MTTTLIPFILKEKPLEIHDFLVIKGARNDKTNVKYLIGYIHSTPKFGKNNNLAKKFSKKQATNIVSELFQNEECIDDFWFGMIEVEQKGFI